MSNLVIEAGIPASEKGHPNGVATLDGDGKLPSSQMPYSSLEYRGELNGGDNLVTNVSSNDYVNTTLLYHPGDQFVVRTDGILTVSDGTIDVKANDTVTINKIVDPKTGILIADVDVNAGNEGISGAYELGLTLPADITGNATGNAYIDSITVYKQGDYFTASSTGTLTVSDGTIEVNINDQILIKDAVAKASIALANVNINSASGGAVSTSTVQPKYGEPIHVLSGKPNSYTLGQSEMVGMTNRVNDKTLFGQSSISGSEYDVIDVNTSIDKNYLAQGNVYFSGYVPNADFIPAELDDIEQWVRNGGILLTSNDSVAYSAISQHFGLNIGGVATSPFEIVNAENPIINGAFGSVGDIGGTFLGAGNIGYFDNNDILPTDLVIANQQGDPTRPILVLRILDRGAILFNSDEGMFRADVDTVTNQMVTPNEILIGNMYAWAAANAVPIDSFCETQTAVSVNTATIGRFSSYPIDTTLNIVDILISDVDITDSGREFFIPDRGGNASVNHITISDSSGVIFTIDEDGGTATFKSDGSNLFLKATSIKNSAGLLGTQIFTASGTYTPNIATKSIEIVLTGAGGAGGGVELALDSGAGSGGAAGATLSAIIAIDSTLTGVVTIGSGGTGVIEANGNNGGNSTFVFSPSNITSNGGSGGDVATTSLGIHQSPDLPDGSISNATLLFKNRGIHGTPSMVLDKDKRLISGSGGKSFYGGDGGYKIFNEGEAIESYDGLSAVINTGSGGGGGIRINTTPVKGGDGADGYCIIYEYDKDIS